MFFRLVRAVEPFLKVFSHRVVSPWKGNHIDYRVMVVHGSHLGDTPVQSLPPPVASRTKRNCCRRKVWSLSYERQHQDETTWQQQQTKPNLTTEARRRASYSSDCLGNCCYLTIIDQRTYSDLRTSIILWGFVSQEKVLESVKPHRAEGRVEKRAEHLNLNTWEFLSGTEQAYRCVARLFAPDFASAGALEDEIAGRDSGSLTSGGRGVRDDDRPVVTSGGQDGAAFGDSAEVEPSSVNLYTNFFDLDVASPQMSMFLNDVLESYSLKGLVPRLSISSVKATLCNVGIRLGGISKNTNFLGLMSADEVKYHLTMGMLGPEGAVINELEGRAPQKVIADVMLTCEEDFVLEDATGKIVHRESSERPKVHYLTLQSNVGEGAKLQWQITNINDVIKPNLAYYFARFGH